MTPSVRRARSVIGAVAPVLAATAATVLSVDDLLGFAGARFLRGGWPVDLAAVAVAAALSGALAALWCRDAARTLVCCSVLFWVALLSPAGGTGISTDGAAAQVAVPVGLVLAARARVPRRATSAVVVVLATVWLVAGLVPVVPLEVCIGVRSLALGATAVLAAGPLLHRAAAVLRDLWRSAEVR